MDDRTSRGCRALEALTPLHLQLRERACERGVHGRDLLVGQLVAQAGGGALARLFGFRFVDILHGDSPIELDGRMLNRINLRDFDRQLEKQGPADEWQIITAMANHA